MQREYYSLPLAVEKLILDQGDHQLNYRPEELRKCSLEQSVMQHLHLLLTTAFGELSSDESFGCSVWENDFDNLTSSHRLKENIRMSLVQTIQQYEKRLGNVRVELIIRQEELPQLTGKYVKKKIDITITGILQSTNERFSFRDSFFVGPLSY
jgi:phage baseplate assembly protein W